MKTSTEILEKTGLKSAKTLSRWAKRGIIPVPHTQTHPSGRGKIGYWPDWVLDRCLRIVELRKRGHSLDSALFELELQRIQENTDKVEKQPSLAKALEKIPMKLPDGSETNLLRVFLVKIASEVRTLIPDPDLAVRLLHKMKEEDLLDLSVMLLHGGYNPVLLYDGGDDLAVVPDFVVSHRLSDLTRPNKPYLVLRLLPPLRRAFASVGIETSQDPVAYPAPKVNVKDGGTILEYGIFPGGSAGFELLRETARVVGRTPVSDKKSLEGGREKS